MNIPPPSKEEILDVVWRFRDYPWQTHYGIKKLLPKIYHEGYDIRPQLDKLVDEGKLVYSDDFLEVGAYRIITPVDIAKYRMNK